MRRVLCYALLGLLFTCLFVSIAIGSPSKSAPSARTNPKDGAKMILIPAGEFLMGSFQGEGKNDEHPQHKVYLDAYYIGKYEVTNEQFARFVRETGYTAQGNWKSYYNSQTANHPVVTVSWNDAVAYCRWAGVRLPTEAEWEKAARGTDARKYPWGNSWDRSRCNLGNRDTKEVGSFPSGASPYGVMDMSGYVWEWCNDWYSEKYYGQSPGRNPEGPGSGSDRVLRGGSGFIEGSDYFFRCAIRFSHRPDIRGYASGFRCARSAP